MTYRCCLFDLDGTLINSLADLAEASNTMLQKKGLPTYPTERYRYFVGRGVPKLIEMVVPEPSRTPEILAGCRQLFDEYYHVHALDHTAPYDGIRPMLAEMARRGLALAVVSNKPDGFVRQIVGAVFPGVFAGVQGQRTGIPRKPDPAMALNACAALGLPPEECLYFGDSGVDMQTACAAGMTAVGVLWGFRERTELLENGARHLIARPEEALALPGVPPAVDNAGPGIVK